MNPRLFEPLMEQGIVKRPGPGRPKLRPQRVVGDKVALQKLVVVWSR